MWHLSHFCYIYPILIMPAEMSVDLKQCIIDWYLVHLLPDCQPCWLLYRACLKCYEKLLRIQQSEKLLQFSYWPGSISWDIVYLPHMELSSSLPQKRQWNIWPYYRRLCIYMLCWKPIQLSTLMSCKFTCLPSRASILWLPLSLEFSLSMNWHENNYTSISWVIVTRHKLGSRRKYSVIFFGHVHKLMQNPVLVWSSSLLQKDHCISLITFSLVLSQTSKEIKSGD